MNIGIFFVILSLLLLMYLAYKGFSVVLIAPILAIFAAVSSTIASGGDPHVMATYTEVFMLYFANFIKSFFPVFLLGAILGKVLEYSGSADSIANFVTSKLGSKHAILAIVLSCAILTYGGVSLFVVSFAIYPIGSRLFKEAGISKKLLPGTIALGAFTFTMTAIPGTPQIQNAIPMKFFGTDLYAAPTLGIVATLVMFFGGLGWLKYRAKVFSIKYPGYGDWKENIKEFNENKSLPNIFVAIIPIFVALIVNIIFAKIYYPNANTEYLNAQYNTTISSVLGTWSLIISLICSIIVAIILNYHRFDSITETLTAGVTGSFLAIFNTGSETGYGNVIASLAVFTIISNAITSISQNPLVVTAISSSALAGVTGSASGGLSIALNTMGDQLLQISKSLNINPEVLHRVAAVACGGLDTLPHNGAVITLLGITQMKHKESYLDIAVNTVIIPLIATFIIIILGSLGIV